MVTEHNICTMVQLNAPAPNTPNPGYHYWDESDNAGSQITYGSLQITLKSKESMPSYVKREFVVYNSKVEEEVNLTHFAYSGWGDAPQRPRSPNPGQGSPEVPKATTGLLDLVEHALAHKVEASLPGPIAVHCRYNSRPFFVENVEIFQTTILRFWKIIGEMEQQQYKFCRTYIKTL